MDRNDYTIRLTGHNSPPGLNWKKEREKKKKPIQEKQVKEYPNKTKKKFNCVVCDITESI
jgi:hypothetical protein